MLRLLLRIMNKDFADLSRLQAIELIFPVAANTWSLEKVQFLMEELDYGTTNLTAHEKTVLNSGLLAVFNQDDFHDQLMEVEPGKDWDSGIQVIRLLVSAGASVNADEDPFARTPLSFAIRLDNMPPRLLDILLEHNARIDVPDFMGCTPMFHFLARPDATIELVDRFKRLGGQLHDADNDGNTPLHLVNSTKIAYLLLSSGASLSSRNNDGESPLLRAIRDRRLNVASLLLDHNANIEAQDDTGRSPLRTIIDADYMTDGFYGSSEQNINYLLKHGADASAVNEAGRAVAQLIDARGYPINELGMLESK